MNQIVIPEEMYTARQGIIQLIGEAALAQKTEEFRPVLRTLCEQGQINVIQAVDALLKSLDATDVDPA